MEKVLTSFRIENLHNYRTVDVNIEDDKLILVGENGSGKSTVVNMIYYFLTMQWHRLTEYNFDRITAYVYGSKLILNQDDLKSISIRERHIPHSFPVTYRRKMDRYIREYSRKEIMNDFSLIEKISEEINIPERIVAEYVFDLFEFGESASKEVLQIEEILSNVDENFLFLPTYRRIEQDLNSILPGIERDYKRQIRRKLPKGKTSTSYLELVEFGMEDVEKTFQRKVSEIKENVRKGLDNLTGLYLRDVIRGNFRADDLLTSLDEMSEESINSIFTRIPENILPKRDQISLQNTISEIRKRNEIDEEVRVVAHFLTQLIDLHKSQQDDEKQVRDFVQVCNKYLVGKKVVYNNLTFEIFVQQLDFEGQPQELPLSTLSSGEKQIVSLFSHLYLSENLEYYLIIDEPELSLSVTWQRDFLPDIINSNHCSGLVAVTHSPFIYDNGLKPYAHSIEEFIEAK